MTKLTPAKRLKQLKASGWLGFVEHMEVHGVSPRQVARNEPDGLIAIGAYGLLNCSLWLAEDVERDLFVSTCSPKELDKMMGLSEQLANPREGAFPRRKKNNKITQRFKKTGEPL